MSLHCFFSGFWIDIIPADQIKSAGFISGDMAIIYDPATSNKSDTIIYFRGELVLECRLNDWGRGVN